MSQPDNEALDEDISRQLTPKKDFQKEFGRPTDKKETPKPYVT